MRIALDRIALDIGPDEKPVKIWNAPMNSYECNTCGYLYDEREGLPEDGIPAGTRWEDIPDDWVCPECGATKSDFTPVQFD